MRVVGESEYSRVGVAVEVIEMDNGKAGMRHIEMKPESGQGNTYDVRQKCKPKSLMREECNALIVVGFDAIFSDTIAYISECREKGIRLAGDPLHTLLEITVGKDGVLIPFKAEIAYLVGVH